MPDIKKRIRRSAWTSVLIGGSLGILSILATISLPVLLTGEGLLKIAFYFSYGHATVGLAVVFIISLWFAGKKAYSYLINEQTLLYTSLKYSIIVNTFSWLTFIIITSIDNYLAGVFNWYILVPPIILSIICPILTTFSLGLFICYIIKRQIPAPNSKQLHNAG